MITYSVIGSNRPITLFLFAKTKVRFIVHNLFYNKDTTRK